MKKVLISIALLSNLIMASEITRDEARVEMTDILTKAFQKPDDKYFLQTTHTIQGNTKIDTCVYKLLDPKSKVGKVVCTDDVYFHDNTGDIDKMKSITISSTFGKLMTTTSKQRIDKVSIKFRSDESDFMCNMITLKKYQRYSTDIVKFECEEF